MTPAARLSAAIECLDLIEEGIRTEGAPADKCVGDYFRARRYAGSKDRRWVRDRVYAIVRNRGALVWRLGATDLGITGRNLLLASLEEGERTLFGGEGHAPDALASEEIIFLENPPVLKMPDWAHLNFPEWLLPHLNQRFGSDLQTECKTLNARAATDLRVNRTKATVKQVRDALQSDTIAAEPVSQAPQALRIVGAATLNQTSAYKEGWFDVQDTAAQIASALVAPPASGKVADLCAGAGGKSLAIADAMRNSGEIFAYDLSDVRLKDLKKRAERADVETIRARRIHPAGGRRDAALHPIKGEMDRVVLDVPCSGSGTWRRNPDQKWRLTAERLEANTKIQDRLLDEGAELTAPNGRLIYMTCSLLPEENEARIEAFLERHKEWRIYPYDQAWKEARLSDEIAQSASLLPGTLQLTPHRHQTDGFFVAILTRRKILGVGKTARPI